MICLQCKRPVPAGTEPFPLAGQCAVEACVERSRRIKIIGEFQRERIDSELTEILEILEEF